MKRIILSFFLCLLIVVGFGQPVIQRATSVNTVADSRLMGQLNLFVPRYADTTAANVSKGIDTCGALIFTYDVMAYWQRACSPKHWVRLAKYTDITTNAWGVLGNSNLTAATNFLGTTDATALVFRVNNTQAGIVDNLSGVHLGNTGFGYGNLVAITTGFANTAIGLNVMPKVTTGQDNTAVGLSSMSNGLTTGYFNTGMGAPALANVSTGNSNTGFGRFALDRTTTGNRNTSIGFNSGDDNTTGNDNIFIGDEAQAVNSAGTGSKNIVIGDSSAVADGTASQQLVIGNFIYGTGFNSGSGTNISTTALVGFGVKAPSAVLHLQAGTATASTAPLKFTAGTNLTAAEAGAMEWNGTNLFISQTSGPTRKTIAYTSDIPAGSTYILNQTGQQASSNFNISGNGVINGTLTVPTITTLSGAINVSPASDINLNVGTNRYTKILGAGSPWYITPDLGTLQMGGTSSSFPELRVNGTGIDIKLADNSALTNLGAAQLHLTGTATTGTGTSSDLSVVSNSLTTGNGVDVTSSSLTTGNVVNIASTSTVINNGNGLSIAMSGANSTASKRVNGQTISVTNTGTTGVNVGLNVTASGASSANYSILATGTIGINTAAPTGALEATGIVTINSNSSALLIKGTTVGGGTFADFRNSDASTRGLFGVDGSTFGGGSNNFIIATWTASPLTFWYNQVERMRLDANGFSIGTTTGAASAIADITSTTKGLLIPRMTTTQKNAISSPATGLRVTDTDLNNDYYFNGTNWQPFLTPNSSGNVAIASTAGEAVLTISSSAAANTVGFSHMNTNANYQSADYVYNDRETIPVSQWVSYGGRLYGGSTNISSNLFGLTRADKLFLFAGGAYNLGMAVGTLTAQPLVLGTNNAQNILINSGGNVSIGGSGNTYKLDVTGTANVSSNTTIGGTLAVTGVTTLNNHLIFSPDNTYDIGANTATRPKNVYVANNIVIGSGTGFGANFYNSGTSIFGNTITVSTLTPSQAVFTNGSSQLVSNAITGTGNVMMSTSPTTTGTLTAAAITASGTVTWNGAFAAADGANKSVGTAVLVAGTVTVSNTRITTNSRVFLTGVDAAGVSTDGVLNLGTIVNGTSFVINSSLLTDTRTVQFFIVN